QRYGSAAALAEDLQRFLAGEPVQARPVGSMERALKWVRRNPMVAALLGVVALTLVVGAAVAWWLALEAGGSGQAARGEKTIAEKALQRAEEEKTRALREKATAEENLVTSQLLRVRPIFENEPERALVLLHDEQAIPVGLRDAAWGFYDNYCRRKVRTL